MSELDIVAAERAEAERWVSAIFESWLPRRPGRREAAIRERMTQLKAAIIEDGRVYDALSAEAVHLRRLEKLIRRERSSGRVTPLKVQAVLDSLDALRKQQSAS